MKIPFEKKKLILPFIAVVALIFLVIYRQPAEQEIGDYVEGRFLLGVPCEVQLAGASQDELRQVAEGAFGVIRSLDEKLSNYKENSEVSQFNNSIAGVPVLISQETYNVIKSSIAYSKISNGSFDITVFPLVKAWGFFDHKKMIPGDDVVNDALAKVGSEKIELFSTQGNYFISKRVNGVEIDLGGIGKGFICDEVAAWLRREGIQDFLVNIGGNIYASGKNAQGENWKIGVKHPREESRLIETVTLTDLAVSTSGDYERFFMHEGKRYAHIINPKTGRPVDGMVAVTAVASSATHADAASTILFMTKKSDLDKAFSLLALERAFVFMMNDEGELEAITLGDPDEAAGTV